MKEESRSARDLGGWGVWRKKWLPSSLTKKKYNMRQRLAIKT